MPFHLYTRSLQDMVNHGSSQFPVLCKVSRLAITPYLSVLPTIYTCLLGRSFAAFRCHSLAFQHTLWVPNFPNRLSSWSVWEISTLSDARWKWPFCFPELMTRLKAVNPSLVVSWEGSSQRADCVPSINQYFIQPVYPESILDRHLF